MYDSSEPEERGIVKLRMTLVSLALAVAAVGPFAGAAQAYHCYSPEFGDCSAVQHAIEDLNVKRSVCVLVSKVTGDDC